MKKYFYLIIGIFFLLTSCQHNDICTENQPSTPKLVIKFYDYEFPDHLKPIEEFNAKAVHVEEFYYENNKNDTLVKIPLQTTENTTTYEFVIHKDQEEEEEKSQQIKFSYSTEEVYINRPCGFRNTFDNFQAELIEENSADWIKEIEILEENIIDDENTTHLYIYH